ncbi:MAG: nitroreductase, partial [Bacteroidaceae bacterium]|nr:nitroreductase [Bacteroidaceae bacterium]
RGSCVPNSRQRNLVGSLQLPYRPLLVVAVGKSAEKIELVDINSGDDHSYYRENGVHYVPKVVVEDLII